MDFNVSPDYTLDDHDEDSSGTGLYADDQKISDLGEQVHSTPGDSSDEVDPRKLFRDPTLSEIRWYYRRTFAETIVKKPIKDAFKNGFDFDDENEDKRNEARGLLESPSYRKTDGFISAHIDAEIKSRRDGWSVLFIGTRDDSAGPHVSPVSTDINVEKISHLKVLTIDNLTSQARGDTHDQIQTGTGLDKDQYQIRKTGIVINTDISSPDFKEPIGYVLDAPTPQFIHADRTVHYVWNHNVDGDFESGSGVRRWNDRDSILGAWEGDSVLLPSYDLMKGIAKGNWAVMQAIFRNAAHMYSVKLPPDADEEDMSNTVGATRNINAKSSIVFPDPDYEIQQHESGGNMEPAEYYEVIFNQVCAVHEMTKSVLFGTQAGTVSGSETDIKNYFNKVERYRSNRGEDKILEYLTLAKRMQDSRTSEDFEFEIEINWGPLFKVDSQTRIQMWQTAAQSLTSLIGNYALTPDEARGILTSEFTEIDLDDLSESQKDTLDRVVLAGMGQAQGQRQSEQEMGKFNSRTGGQEGGRPEGAQQEPEGSSTTPQADTGALIDHIMLDARQGEFVETSEGEGLVFETKESSFEFDGETIEPDGEVEVVALRSGGSIVWDADDEKVIAQTSQSVDMDLPEGWDRDSLLDWWESVGADFTDARKELEEERDISEQQAKKVAARMKDMALGTTGWRGENGF